MRKGICRRIRIFNSAQSYSRKAMCAEYEKYFFSTHFHLLTAAHLPEQLRSIAPKETNNPLAHSLTHSQLHTESFPHVACFFFLLLLLLPQK